MDRGIDLGSKRLIVGGPKHADGRTDGQANGRTYKKHENTRLLTLFWLWNAPWISPARNFAFLWYFIRGFSPEAESPIVFVMFIIIFSFLFPRIVIIKDRKFCFGTVIEHMNVR